MIFFLPVEDELVEDDELMEDMDWPSTLPIRDNNLDEVEAGGPERLKWDSEENETNNTYIFDWWSIFKGKYIADYLYGKINKLISTCMFS